jgi:hypothetical protein
MAARKQGQHKTAQERAQEWVDAAEVAVDRAKKKVLAAQERYEKVIEELAKAKDDLVIEQQMLSYYQDNPLLHRPEEVTLPFDEENEEDVIEESQAEVREFKGFKGRVIS